MYVVNSPGLECSTTDPPQRSNNWRFRLKSQAVQETSHFGNLEGTLADRDLSKVASDLAEGDCKSADQSRLLEARRSNRQKELCRVLWLPRQVFPDFPQFKGEDQGILTL